jgi:hypothetical protein
MERRTSYGASIADERESAGKAAPPWWPYGKEFPSWYVWRGVTGLYYARVPGISPQRVLRAPSAAALRDQIISSTAPYRATALAGLRKSSDISAHIIPFGCDHSSCHEAPP